MPTFSRNYNTGSTRRTGFNRRTTTGTTSGGTWSGTPTGYNTTKFNNYREQIQSRIGSYKAINTQFNGTTCYAFSPTTAKQWIGYVNNGASVYTFSTAQFSRYFGSGWNNASPTAAFRHLRKKFGAGIKGVTRGRGNNWLICASQNVTSRPFATYNWN